MTDTLFCHPQFRRRDGHSIRSRATQTQYTPRQVCAKYSIPIAQYDGTGQVIGIIELGGQASQPDLDTYMDSMGLPRVPFTVKLVNGATIQPDPQGADVEVMLDLCIIAAIAPKAAIILYFADNTDAGFTAAVKAACAECDVVSISWGAPESQWSASSRAAMDAVLQAAASAGVSVFVAAGDNGSTDGTSSDVTDYPASSPWSIGCGGTALLPNGTETVWNNGVSGGATGGGFSTYYALPSYQQNKVPGSKRGVPDVAGNADPETGWVIRANGQNQSVGGTSAVAPMWAAIQALKNQQLGSRMGFGNLLYYQHPEWFVDIITGNNGDFQAGPNWDGCTGNGSPKGQAMFAVSTSPPPPPGSPPPPPVSPPSPPPVSPPPPPVTPPGLEQTIIADINAWFDNFEKKYARHPVIMRVLEVARHQIIQLVQQAFASGTRIATDTVTVLVQQTFAYLEQQFPGLSLMLNALEPLVLQGVLQLFGARMRWAA